jgi:hypothetical protein
MPAFNAPQAKHDLTWYWQARGQLIGFFWGRRHLCAGETSGYIKAEDHEIYQSQPRLARIIGQFIAVVIARVCIVVSAERPGSDKTGPSEFGCGDRI